MGGRIRGNLVIIGGAEDKSGSDSILNTIARLSGRDQGRLLVLTTATESPEKVGVQYRENFLALGMKSVSVLDINTREEADREDFSDAVANSTGIFFTGGDQLRITSILGGTAVCSALYRAFERGTLIAGTSAGASVMSGTMIVDGNNNDPARKCTLKMAPGLGLLEGVIIDQHFDQRGRIGRLLCGVAENPSMLGIGIDENTAILVLPDNRFEVLGSNAVTVIDGKTMKSSNVSELKPDEILAITGVTLHVLPAGYGFDMMHRTVLRLENKTPGPNGGTNENH